MARQAGFNNRFNAGELEPDVWASSDLVQHAQGCALARNFIGRVAGALERRPPFAYVGEGASGLECRLFPFVRTPEDAVMLEMTANVLRIRDAGGALVLDGDDDPILVSTPWGGLDLPRLRPRQIGGDVMLFLHADGQQPWRLVRLAPTSWSLGRYAFVNGPWLGENLNPDRSMTVSSLEAGDTATVTTSEPVTSDGAEVSHVTVTKGQPVTFTAGDEQWTVTYEEMSVE